MIAQSSKLGNSAEKSKKILNFQSPRTYARNFAILEFKLRRIL